MDLELEIATLLLTNMPTPFW